MKLISKLLIIIGLCLFTVGCFQGKYVTNPDGTQSYQKSGFEKTMDVVSGFAGLSGVAIAQILGILATGAGALVYEKNRKGHKGEALEKSDYLKQLIVMIESYGKKNPDKYDELLDHFRDRMPSSLKDYVKDVKSVDLIKKLKLLL